MKNLCLLLSVLLFACQSGKKEKSAASVDITERIDPHSFAEPKNAVVKHLDLDLAIDFNTQIITGKASWQIQNLNEADTIIFDTRQLTIQKVVLDDSQQEAGYKLGAEVKYLGKPLKIKIENETKKITIWYKTTKNAAALQWLNPQQTAGKKYPFLFTQSQAILARTWVPCQDSPGIRFTYNTTVSVPKELLAVMSAENPQQKSPEGKYTFKQPHPISSYLLALAVGDIQFKAVDSRAGVYAEPATLKKAALEFADMGKMIVAAEKLYGPYQWGRFDVLVLPPSFPFGGMENPMLTFATPTIIAGDKSLVSVIAHELAHSWSGNLVTNATWNDFWLNEGFTTYFERRIVEEVYGEDEANMQEVLGFKSLQEEIKNLGAKHADTKLKGNFEGRDPDEGVTAIAYEKGYALLKVIEKQAGRAQLDAFLNEYFKSNKFKALTTEDFVLYLQKNLIVKDPTLSNKIKISEWIYEPGIPANSIPVGSQKFKVIDSLLADTALRYAGLKNKIISASERLYFIKSLPDSLGIQKMFAVDREFNFTSTKNAELQCAWYLLAIRNKYSRAYPNIELFLTAVGRRKFIVPLYQEMIKTPAGKIWAKKVYEKARPNYHALAYTFIDELLK